MIDKSEWHSQVLSLANIVLDLYSAEIKSASGKPWVGEYILDKVEAYLRRSPTMEGELYDLIRHTDLREFDASWWAEESDWMSVIYNVSFHCLAHDVASRVTMILEGKAPRRTSPLNFDTPEGVPDEDQ